MAITESFVLPQRMYFVDLRTAETMEALFNPSELEESLEVLYNELGVPGLSHSPLQYSGTGNHKFGFELYAVGDGATQRAQIEDFRRFLLSLCYPAAAADSVLTGAPPRVLFVWPELVSLQARILGVTFKHQRFALDGGTTRYVATLKVSEIRDARLTSEDVRRLGTMRSGSAGESPV
jgi:hypothetical protein